MRTYEAFDATLSEFDIVSAQLSRDSGVHKTTISKFRNGEVDCRADIVDRMIETLDPRPKAFYSLLLAGVSPEKAKIACDMIVGVILPMQQMYCIPA